MGGERTAVLAIGTALIVGGLGLIARQEFASQKERLVGGVRHIVEVMLPITAAIALLSWVWVAR